MPELWTSEELKPLTDALRKLAKRIDTDSTSADIAQTADLMTHTTCEYLVRFTEYTSPDFTINTRNELLEEGKIEHGAQLKYVSRERQVTPDMPEWEQTTSLKRTLDALWEIVYKRPGLSGEKLRGLADELVDSAPKQLTPASSPLPTTRKTGRPKLDQKAIDARVRQGIAELVSRGTRRIEIKRDQLAKYIGLSGGIVSRSQPWQALQEEKKGSSAPSDSGDTVDSLMEKIDRGEISRDLGFKKIQALQNREVTHQIAAPDNFKKRAGKLSS